jgi:pyrroloquinoline quinone biosynthesis protein B
VRQALACLALAACAGVPVPPPAGERFELFVLGIAQDGGLPHLGCDRACCAEARRTGRRLRPACLGVHDRATGRLALIEATPAVESQVADLHRSAGVPPRGRDVADAVLITHAHVGHYLGLAHFGREVAATRALPVFATSRTCAFLREHGPWRQLAALDQIALHEIAPRAPFAPLDGLAVVAVPVPHRDEFSDTVAFKIRGPRRTALFVPDVDRWDKAPGLLEELLDGVDVAFVDGTFWDARDLPGRSMLEVPHPPMTDTMQRLAARARARPGTIRFLHLNHTNPALHDAAVRRRIEDAGFAVAAEGERHAL